MSRLTCVHDVAMAAVNEASIAALCVRVRVHPPRQPGPDNPES